MGCGFGANDDYEKCRDLIDEYTYLLEIEEENKFSDKKLEKHNKEKEDIKEQIKELLETINNNAKTLSEIEGLQKLNEKFQSLLTNESKIKNCY